MGALVIGVLALQGAFARHAEMLRTLGAEVIEVRRPDDLLKCDGLVIPGGESTTMMKQIQFINLVDSLKQFSLDKPVFGTCAGLILMSNKVLSDSMQPFKLLDVDVERNAFGRQVESFHTDLNVDLNSRQPKVISALFIRAPRIKRIGEGVKILASFEGEPVLVRQGNHLGASFHPELTADTSIHAYFLSLVAASKG